ncbi:creatininase family protein [Halobacteriales archaeon Cl-PHB]
MHLSEATWTDADAADADLAILPVGSTEQHGPHAPLGTDHLSAAAVADRGAAEYPDDVVVAPPIPVGIAAEHRQFTGTLWVQPDTFRSYVRETVQSLAAHGWDRVVVVNGHGGNTDALRECCGDLVRNGDVYAVPFTWFDAVDPSETDLPEGEGMGHGGPLETSLLYAIHPELVREERLAEAGEGAAAGWGEWSSGTNLAFDSAEFSENGAVGDPREATAEVGEQLLDAAGTALANLLADVASRDVSRPEHK